MYSSADECTVGICTSESMTLRNKRPFLGPLGYGQESIRSSRLSSAQHLSSHLLVTDPSLYRSGRTSSALVSSDQTIVPGVFM